MVNNETEVKYDPKGNEELRTTAYLMAIEVNHDSMINGDIVPIIFYKEKRRMKREIRGKKIHARPLRQTYSIHELTNRTVEMPDEKGVLPEETYVGLPEEIISSAIFSSDPKNGKTVIKDRRGKTFEPLYNNEGNIEDLQVQVSGIPQSNIMQKITTVERLSKELIDESVKKRIYPADYCTAVNALHEIASSGVYNSKNVQMAASCAKTSLETDFLIVPYGMQSHILNIRNSLCELSEI